MTPRVTGALVAMSLATAVACGRGTPGPERASPMRGPDGPPESAAPPPATARDRAPIPQADLDGLADRYRTACGAPGAAVGVRRGADPDRFALAGAFALGVPLARDSQFLAGSVTKLFVAAVAYQLIAAGDLSPDATVAEFVPDWPAGDRITVEMLLGHRSGMGDFGNDFGAQLRELVLADLSRVHRYDEVLDLVRRVPRVAEPGATYHYSNANTIVLGAILQRVTDRSLGQLLDARLIRPLQLSRTIYGPDDLAAAEAVTFHGLFDVAGTGTPIDIGAFPRTAALTIDPAGAGLISTIPDLLTATNALFRSDLLAPAQRAALAASVSTLTAADLLLDERFAIHGHGGASPGAQTIVAYDEAHDTTVAVWCNRLDPGEHELLASIGAARELLLLAAGD